MLSSAPVLTIAILFSMAHLNMSHKFQRVQNSLARIVLQSDNLAHSKPLLRQLHWLPVHSRIRFKLATITFMTFCTLIYIYLNFAVHGNKSKCIECYPLYKLSSISRFAHSLSSTSPFSSLLRPALSCPHSIQH